MDTFVGRRLGKYQIEALVGRGGMATVYRAHDTVLNRAVAIKVLDPNLTVDPRSVERFKREAVTAANLEHPAIVRVYDVQQQGNMHYIAMRFVNGTTLRDILRDNGPLPLDAILNIARPVAEALHYAHRHGVIHRDVKPGNILVEPDGSVLLTDFGIARAGDSAQAGLTATGLVMGTADYLAPEQISGRPADPRSDIYSLGVVLYEMLTGVTPFAGENTASILYKQVHDPPPPLRSMNPRLPSELQPVVDRALAKNPALRYADPLDMVRDLEEIAQWLPPDSPWLTGRRPPPDANGRRPSSSSGMAPPVQVKTYSRPYTPYTGPHTGGSRPHEGAYDVEDDYAQRPLAVARPRQGASVGTWVVLLAVLLVALGVWMLVAASGRLPGFGGPGGAGESRFQMPGPTAASLLRTGNGDDIRVPRALVPLAVDGNLSDWEGAPAYPAPFVTHTARGSSWDGPDDLSAGFYFAWDDDNFYIGAVITDDAHVQLPTTRGYDLYYGDDIEMWFDLDLPGDFAKSQADGDDFQLGLSPGNFADLGPEAVFWNPNKSEERNAMVEVVAQPRATGNGYTLEARVPWAVFGDFRPQPGMAMGFAASAGDNDQQGRRIQEVMISTVPALEYQQPKTFGNMIF